MANWNTLKTAVADVINANGNQAITGQLLQNVLNNIITNVGENATFAGIATLDTNPGAPDGPVFYLTTTAGTHSNFNGIEVLGGEAAILLWSNSTWSKKTLELATQAGLAEVNYKDIIVRGYVTSSDTKTIFSPSTNSNYLTAIRKVEPGQKLIVYTDALYSGYDSLAAFTASEIPASGQKLTLDAQMSVGNNIKLNVGYNEIIVPDSATYFYMTIKFADKLGLPENKIIASYSDYAMVKKIQVAETLEDSLENLNTSVNNIQSVTDSIRMSNGEIYKGYITTSDFSKLFNPHTSNNYLTYFLKVTPGEQLIIFTDNAYSYPNNLAAFSADSEISAAQKLNTNISLQAGWNTITVPESAQLFGITIKFADKLGLPENKIIASYSDYAIAKKIQLLENQAYAVKKGYIPSKGAQNFFTTHSSSDYLTYFLNVTPGEQIIVYTDTLYSGYDSLAAFTASEIPTGAKKIGDNINLRAGWNTITVPESAQLFGMTIKFADKLGLPENKIVAKAPELGVLKKIQNLESAIANVNKEQKPIRVLYDGGYVLVSTRMLETEDLIQRVFFDNTEGNKNINLIDAYLAQAGTTSATRFIKSCGDDICPAYVNGSYIGGNHGWNSAKKLIAAEHGKTTADIGAIYQDENGVRFYLIAIESADTLIVHSQNLNNDGTYRFSSPSGFLSYISNGNSTSDITFTSVTNVGNTYGFINPSDKKILIDGVALQEEGTFYANEVALIEHYNVYDLPSTLNAITSNRPEGGYTSPPDFWNLPGAEILFTHVVSYSFDKRGGMTVGTTLIPQKKLTLSFHGITQAQVISGSKQLYCPKTVARQVGSKIYDLNKLADWSVAPPADIIINPSYYADLQSPPDRAVMRNDFMSFACGYMLDRGVLVNRKNMVSNYAMHFATTRKLYPMGVCEGATLQQGEAFSAVAYRTYYCQENQPPERTNYSIVELKEKIRIFVDYHGTIIDHLPIDNTWVGRKMVVVEKNNKCQLMGDVVTGEIMILSNATADENGYIVVDIE